MAITMGRGDFSHPVATSQHPVWTKVHTTRLTTHRRVSEGIIPHRFPMDSQRFRAFFVAARDRPSLTLRAFRRLEARRVSEGSGRLDAPSLQATAAGARQR